jgi:hypothetical protein
MPEHSYSKFSLDSVGLSLLRSQTGPVQGPTEASRRWNSRLGPEGVLQQVEGAFDRSGGCDIVALDALRTL